MYRYAVATMRRLVSVLSIEPMDMKQGHVAVQPRVGRVFQCSRLSRWTWNQYSRVGDVRKGEVSVLSIEECAKHKIGVGGRRQWPNRRRCPPALRRPFHNRRRQAVSDMR